MKTTMAGVASLSARFVPKVGWSLVTLHEALSRGQKKRPAGTTRTGDGLAIKMARANYLAGVT